MCHASLQAFLTPAFILVLSLVKLSCYSLKSVIFHLEKSLLKLTVKINTIKLKLSLMFELKNLFFADNKIKKRIVKRAKREEN